MRTLTAAICLIAIYGVAGPAPAAGSADEEAMARRLLNSQGCRGCHRFESGTAEVGPQLDDVGTKLSRDEIYSTLVNPGRLHGNGLIPDFSHLSDEEIDVLVDFLHNRP